MPAIKATNSKNITIESCSFVGFETDIELENVDGFISKNNQFSQGNSPKLLLSSLSIEITNSNLDKSSRERLSRKIIKALSSKTVLAKEEENIKNSLSAAVGRVAVDFFTQLSAAVIAGLVIKL